MMENFEDRYLGDFCLMNDVARLSVDTIHQWLADESYWARGRSRATVETSLEHSCAYGVLSPDGATVAFMRVITDRATFGWITDVFVAPAVRGRGLGTWMVGQVSDYWLDAGIPRLLLGTADAHDVYARHGFHPLARPERFMEIDRRTSF
jgi:GNAT superfamily N-acetyltransferase